MTGLASGALCYDLELAPGAAREIVVAVPQVSRSEPKASDDLEFRARAAASEDHKGGSRSEAKPRPAAEALAATSEAWQTKLGQVALRVPESAQPCVDALRTAAAHILVVRDGPALQPGPRRYTRSWIRDAAVMCAALLRMGCIGEVREFLRWYVPFQAADGNVPCCVDRNGPDWLPEHDSHGQFIYTAAEYTASAATARWPWSSGPRSREQSTTWKCCARGA